MSTVRPFRGVRPRADLAARVASPPYDVLSLTEARALAADNPHSFLRINRAELELPDGVDPHGADVYRHAAANLDRFLAEGVLVRDPRPSFYLYRLTMGGKSQTGLVALTSVAEYESGLIKKHEHTRPQKVADRADHISTLRAQVGPVFSTFRQAPGVARAMAVGTAGPPSVEFIADDGIHHALWVVDDPEAVDGIVSAFESVPALYIADGHHRSEAAAEVARRARTLDPDHRGTEPVEFFLNVLFPDEELRILPYNRVVAEVDASNIDAMLARAREHFEIAEASGVVEPERHQFGLYMGGRWYLLTAKPDSFDAEHPTRSIDAAILSDNFLGPILGITDLRTDARIDFVGGIRGTDELVRLVDGGDAGLAFSLHPTSIDQLLAVADAGEVMPPKSTWFEPKLRSGMVVNLLKD